MGYLQKGALPKLSLYCPLDEEDSIPGSGKPTDDEDAKQQSNVKKS